MADPNKKSQTTPEANAAPAGVEPMKNFQSPKRKKLAPGTGRGGRRVNAGRKPGIPNKASAAREAKLAEGGEMPLEYFLRIMRDKRQKPARRDWAADKASRFCHPTLAAVEQVGDPEKKRTMDEVADARGALAGRIAGIVKRKGKDGGAGVTLQ
jgi:hypothetical protein